MTPDALHAVASKVEREWGSYGYSFNNVVDIGAGGALGHVSHHDGSAFYVASDRHGNTSHGDTRIDAIKALLAAKQESAL